jgi:PTS system nitrogen regulatory IIA component
MTSSVLQWLRPDEVALDVEARDRPALLNVAAALCERSTGLRPAPVFRALSRREDAGSTALGHGIAIPHARIPDISRPVTLYLRTHVPLDFAAPDGKPVSQFFVILVPAEGANEDHLQLLAQVAKMFSDNRFCARLATAHNAVGAQAMFAEWCDDAGDGDASAWRPGGA